MMTYVLHRKNKITTTKVLAEQVEEEDLVACKIPLKGYCSKFNNSDASNYEEDFGDFPTFSEKKKT